MIEAEATLPNDLSYYQAQILTACRVSERVYCANPFLPRQNFYSQQLRALALAAELKRTVFEPGRRNISVVGAGITGKTLAVALRSLGANVTLVDRADKSFEVYRNSIHREIHPNLAFWPIQKPMLATGLPFLNWSQGSASDIVHAVRNEWDTIYSNFVKKIVSEVTSVFERNDRVTISLSSGQELESDICVLATGFAQEVAFSACPTPSYWSTDSVSTSRRSVLVSGVGDGGLIDALAPILGPHVTKIANEVALQLSDSPVLNDILVAEESRSKHKKTDSGDSDDPCSFYATFSLEDGVSSVIDRALPPAEELFRKKVTLIYKGASAYSHASAPINKVLISHFSRPPLQIIHHMCGQLREAEDGRLELLDKDGIVLDANIVENFDSIVVRHGAAPGVLKVLSGSEVQRLRDQANQCCDLSGLKDYDRRYFYWSEHGLGNLRISRSSFPKLVREIIAKICRAYDLDIEVGKIYADSQYTARPIEVEVAEGYEDRVERLGIFPLVIGPSRVILKARDLTREVRGM